MRFENAALETRYTLLRVVSLQMPVLPMAVRIFFLKHSPDHITPTSKPCSTAHHRHAQVQRSHLAAPTSLLECLVHATPQPFFSHTSASLQPYACHSLCPNTFLYPPAGHTLLLCLIPIHLSLVLTNLGQGPAMCFPVQPLSLCIVLTCSIDHLLGLLCGGREWGLSYSPLYASCCLLGMASRGTQEYLLKE